jgi:hypothetical protein
LKIRYMCWCELSGVFVVQYSILLCVKVYTVSPLLIIRYLCWCISSLSCVCSSVFHIIVCESVHNVSLVNNKISVLVYELSGCVCSSLFHIIV